MPKWMTLMRAAWSRLATPPNWDEAYLNEAVDAIDLERRMRQLDHAQHSDRYRGLTLGLENHR